MMKNRMGQSFCHVDQRDFRYDAPHYHSDRPDVDRRHIENEVRVSMRDGDLAPPAESILTIREEKNRF